MKILDLSAGNRAIWFDRDYPDTVYVDIRPETRPTIVADSTKLPASVGVGFDLIVFDPPHKNNGLTGKMTPNYGHWTAHEIRIIIIGTAKEAHRVTRKDALLAFKWNDHSRKLKDILEMLSLWWEPLFGHGVKSQQRCNSMTSWVMLRRRCKAEDKATEDRYADD